MYHYVKTFDRKLPYFNFLHKESFKKQIKFFENKFKINKINDIDIFENKKILLTFDDGTKDHYWVANYLEKKNYGSRAEIWDRFLPCQQLAQLVPLRRGRVPRKEIRP